MMPAGPDRILYAVIGLLIAIGVAFGMFATLAVWVLI